MLRSLLETAGDSNFRGNRADCPHCQGQTRLTVRVSEDKFFCHRCRRGGTTRSLARELGRPLPRETAAERAERQRLKETNRILDDAHEILAALERGLSRGAIAASRCLARWIPENKNPELQELAWGALERYVKFQNLVERERIHDRDVMLAELALLKGIRP